MDITRVGKDSKFGYSIRDGVIWEEQRIILEHNLARLNLGSVSRASLAMEIKDGQKIYLSRDNGPLFIFGLGKKENGPKTDGVVWAIDDKFLIEALYWANIGEYFPFKIVRAVYLIHNGKVYIAQEPPAASTASNTGANNGM